MTVMTALITCTALTHVITSLIAMALKRCRVASGIHAIGMIPSGARPHGSNCWFAGLAMEWRRSRPFDRNRRMTA